MKQLRSILAYDAEWKSPEITEQHAFLQADKLLPEVPGVLYFGFPWATLIDRLNLEESSADSLREAINSAKLLLNEQKYVVTVCQHVDMLKFQELFKENGITHVFWAHAVKGQDCFPGYEQIKIMPFPLRPVQATAFAPSRHAARKYLYSFIEPRSDIKTLSNSTKMILANLTGKQGGLVISHNKVDFDKVLFGTSIHDEVDTDQNEVDRAAPIEFARILQESIFSLCPSGVGPNSMRLWESIGWGSIPVVLSGNYLPPGSSALWDLATVSCPERLEDILALPERLAAIARDEELLEQKRHALQQLWMLYGPGCFIYDIQKFFLSLAQEYSDNKGESGPDVSYGRLFTMAAAINLKESVHDNEFDIFILGCSSRLLSDPSGFLNRYQENEQFRMAYMTAISSCDRRNSEAMQRNLAFKGIDLNLVGRKRP